jgi:hypothetical protein
VRKADVTRFTKSIAANSSVMCCMVGGAVRVASRFKTPLLAKLFWSQTPAIA